jgi:RNA polymerase sigma-70 factor (ECF subfamily)
VNNEADRLLADQELVARAQAGDLHAMHDLIAVLRPAIFKFCRFRLSPYGGGDDAADDAAQETCLAVSKVLGGYRDQGLPFKAWVYAIAANKVADSQRRFSRAAIPIDELPEQVEPSPTPEERVIASLQFRTALALMERLPARMRDVLLRRASGATAKRVAEDLGMSAGAVNVAHHRAVIRLRELVDESEEHRELFAPFRGRSNVPTLGRAA